MKEHTHIIQFRTSPLCYIHSEMCVCVFSESLMNIYHITKVTAHFFSQSLSLILLYSLFTSRLKCSAY